MIAQITGRVVARTADAVTLAVGGIGIEVVATRAALRLAAPGSTVTLPTHLHVRDDVLQLFGFGDDAERVLFRLLLSVSGIGPKLALAVVSTIPADQLARAIIAEDAARLGSVPGVGRKTAQRIVVDLRDRLGGERDQSAPAGRPDLNDPHFAAREALVALGFGISDAEAALVDADGDADQRVRAALGRMRRVGA
jgi:holliday junction DNA helicase RuvA